MTRNSKSPVPDPLPKHVAIIMDGNGRWAEARELPRLEGHRRGHLSVRAVVTAAAEIGIGALTLYAFSSENWRRSSDEVEGLMYIIEEAARAEIIELHRQHIRFRVTGRLSELSDSLRAELQRDMEMTAANTGLTLNLAINYGGRAEITDAARRIAELAALGELRADQVNEELFSSFLYAPDLADPDLLIRTAGEMRLSNFLLWQSAYCELYVTPVLWPDFGEKEFVEALEDYARRERRFGKVKGVIAD